MIFGKSKYFWGFVKKNINMILADCHNPDK